MKQQPVNTDVQKWDIQSQIDSLTEQMTSANVIDTMNAIGALTVELKIINREPDFTMNNRMDWGVRFAESY